MKLVRAFVAAALVTSVLAPATMAYASTSKGPEHDFDTNNDGKIDLKIYDSNNDGFYEWPTGRPVERAVDGQHHADRARLCRPQR